MASRCVPGPTLCPPKGWWYFCVSGCFVCVTCSLAREKIKSCRSALVPLSVIPGIPNLSKTTTALDAEESLDVINWCLHQPCRQLPSSLPIVRYVAGRRLRPCPPTTSDELLTLALRALQQCNTSCLVRLVRRKDGAAAIASKIVLDRTHFFRNAPSRAACLASSLCGSTRPRS